MPRGELQTATRCPACQRGLLIGEGFCAHCGCCRSCCLCRAM